MYRGFSIESRLKLPERYRYERVLGHPPFKPGQRQVIAELEGPGCIRHIFAAFRAHYQGSFYRNYILRIYWDGEEQPSVEAPAADFFGIHHDLAYYPINNFFISAKDERGHACYFPMPFARSARIEIEATDLHPPPMPFVYTIDWHKYLTDSFDEELRFHAAWRRENPAPAWADDFFTLDALGRGYLLGWSLGVRLRKDGMRWTHSGSENFYLDGEATGEDGIVPHYLRQAGGENTFDAGHGGVRHLPDTYLYAGFPYWEHQDHGPALARHVLSGYRFYVHDLVPFNTSLHMRWGSQPHNYCMTTYWYQTEPHRRFVKIPVFADLEYGRGLAQREVPRGKYDLLKQIGAEGPDAILASPDDGTWMLYRDAEALRQPAAALADGIRRQAFHGFLDFSHVFNVRSLGSNQTWPCNATAVTTLEVDRDTPATMHLSWDDRMLLRLNNGPVRDLGKHPTYRYRAVPVRLQQGENTVALNLDRPDEGLSWGAFTFSCRVVLPDGRVVIPRAP